MSPRPTYQQAIRTPTVVDALAPLLSGENPDGSSFALPGLGVTLEDRARAGRVLMAGTGRVSLALAGALRATLTNPPGSGRTLYVFRLTGLTTATGWATFIINPTGGLPTTVRPVSNSLMGSAYVPTGEVRADSGAGGLTGGTDTGIVIGVGVGSRAVVDLPPLAVPAGVVLGISMPFTGSADVSAVLQWWEEDA